LKEGLLAALTVLLVGHGLALAQPSATVAPSPQPITGSPPSTFDSDPVGLDCHGDVDAQANTFGLWGSGEYLLWWFKHGRVPPLVTGGGNGVPGSPGTRVLVDNLDFDDDFRQGGRFALGYRFAPCLGVEASYFFVSDRQTDEGFSSSGDPVLGRPYIDVATGRPAATLISAPGIAAGTVDVGARTSLWGAEANLTNDLIASDHFHLTALGGFRFLQLEDELTIGEQFRFAGNFVTLQDEFRTVNNFYGGQLGLQTGAQFGRLTIDVRGKVALGQMHQAANINGATGVLAPDGSTTIFEGGLLALRSNIGHYQRDELAYVPEVGLNIGLQLTRHVKLYAGYSFLWVNTVARAGEQIDPVVNISQFPIRSGNGPLVGLARPAFHFNGTDFWAQGLNFGLELKY